MPTPTVQNFVKSGAIDVLLDTANNIVARVPIFSITRVGTTATIKAYSHGLSTGSYTVIGAGAAAYNITATLTVVDPDTLTYTVAGSPATPDPLTSGGAWILDPTYSNTATGVAAVQVEVPPAGTTLQIQKRLHVNGSWAQEGSDITSASQVTIVQWATPMPMVRIKRSAGTGNGLAFWQKGQA